MKWANTVEYSDLRRINLEQSRFGLIYNGHKPLGFSTLDQIENIHATFND